MLLSDRDLRAEIQRGQLRVHPLADHAIQPASIDVHLDRYFRTFNRDGTPIDPRAERDHTTLTGIADDQPFTLFPGEFALGSTAETISVGQGLAARLEGKSSLGRLGIMVHSTAGFIDPGFVGTITLELSNLAPAPVLLWPGMPIGQLCVLRLTSMSEHPYGHATYGSRYQHQRGPTPSRAWMQQSPRPFPPASEPTGP